MNYNKNFEVGGCMDRGLCKAAVGKQDRQLNTYDWLADIPGNTDITDLVAAIGTANRRLPPATSITLLWEWTSLSPL